MTDQSHVPQSQGQTAESLGSDTVRSGTEHTERDAGEAKSGREAMRASRGRGPSIQRSVKETSDKLAKAPPAAQNAPQGDPAAAPAQWQPPGWAKIWATQQGQEGRLKAIQALSENQDIAEHYKALSEGLDQFHKWDGERNVMIGRYRQAFDPISQIVGEMDQQYRRQGMSLQQGLGQLWQTAQDLATDPDATMARIGNVYKPRNAAQVLQYLAQAWGADLNQMVQQAPYIDPAVARQLNATQQQLRAITEERHREQQGQRMAQYNALIQHITQFETEKDASGNLKYPYAAEVGQEMGLLLQMGKANSLPMAYEMATKYHPKAQEDRQKAAEKAARDAAARATTEAEQAKSAARNVNGRPGARDTRPRNMDEAVRRAEKQVYGR